MMAMAIFSTASMSTEGYCLTGSGSRGIELSLDSGRLVDLLRSEIRDWKVELIMKFKEYIMWSQGTKNIICLQTDKFDC